MSPGMINIYGMPPTHHPSEKQSARFCAPKQRRNGRGSFQDRATQHRGTAMDVKPRGKFRRTEGHYVGGTKIWVHRSPLLILCIVFQIMILSALSVGDIRQYDLLPLAFSKSLSGKL